ncbi:unnamed protein product [Meganyctiphanes norvegica]|uniref:C2H2-type domain-containing protein n=1 Tax=Meganyctiphanes norvegica TaxID=48144 RepID=A0AAV2QR44_MEGNR
MAIIGENAIIDSLEIQTEERMYPCSQCDQAYTSNILLVSHMKTHTEKPYQCSHCGKAFSTNKALKRHQKTHTGEKPYECINCGKAYTLLSNLKVHYRSHTGEKPYKCKYCSKAFSRSEVCVIHTRIHTGERPFRCNVCSKAFYAKSRLMEHMRTHTGEKPYKCTQCDKAFAHKTVLRDHELAHNQSQTGEKPYQCSKCNKRFALIRYLRNHVRRKHNTDNSIAMIEVNSESHTSENHEQSNNSNISIDTNSNATNAAVCIMAYASACLSEKVKPNSFQRVMDQYFVANNLPTIKHPVPDKDIIEYYSTKYMALNSGSTPSNTESVVPDKSPSGDSNLNNINNYHKSSSHEMMVLNTNVDDDNSICLVSNSDFESAIEDNISEESNSNSQANNHVKNI